MVADAVVVEPVSTVKFPTNREMNREFSILRQCRRLRRPANPMKSRFCSQIPYNTEQGISCEEQGNVRQDHGSRACRTTYRIGNFEGRGETSDIAGSRTCDCGSKAGPSPAPYAANDQLMSEHCILSFKPALRLERRSQDGQGEAEQCEHCPLTSMRRRFSVHTAHFLTPAAILSALLINIHAVF